MSFKKFKNICDQHFNKNKTSLAEKGYKKGALVKLDNAVFGYDTEKLYIVVEVSGIDCPMIDASSPSPAVKLLSVKENKFITRHPSMPITVVKEGKDDDDLYLVRDTKANWKNLSKAQKVRFLSLYGGSK